VLASSTEFWLGLWPCGSLGFSEECFMTSGKDAVCSCGYVRKSIEVKRMHQNCHPLSKVGGVAAADDDDDDDQFHILFVRGTQDEKEDPSCSSLLDGL
jgi:hypothetical protein